MRSERGAMAVVMSAAIAVLGLLVVAVTSLGNAYAARAQAQTAADAAALAAAVATYPGVGRPSPAAEARRVADINQARLVRCVCSTDGSLRARTVTVITAIDIDVPVFGELSVRGAARGEFDPRHWLGR